MRAVYWLPERPQRQSCPHPWPTGLGLTVPAIGLGAAAAGVVIGFGKEKANEVWERQRASETMLGMFACAKPK